MNQQEFIQKVFSMCQHQIQTKNPYTGELIMVPCGTCPACRFNKSILSQNKVHAQSLVSRHVYFITLTYAQTFRTMNTKSKLWMLIFLRLLLIVVIVTLCIVLIRIVVPSIS